MDLGILRSPGTTHSRVAAVGSAVTLFPNEVTFRDAGVNMNLGSIEDYLRDIYRILLDTKGGNTAPDLHAAIK